MKKIDITITEELLNGYNITVDELAGLAGYQPLINNPNFEEGVGTPDLPNPDYIEGINDRTIPNLDYIAPIGERFIENPKPAIMHLAEYILANGISILIEKVNASKKTALQQAIKTIDEQSKLVVTDIIGKATINVVN